MQQDPAAADTSQVVADTSNILETVNDIVNGFLAFIPKIVLALIVLAIFYFIAKGVKTLVRRSTKNREAASLGMVLGRLAQLAILLAGLLVAVGIVAPSVGASEFFQLLGIGSVAIGFAFRDILQNYLAGILILLRQPFRIGDQLIFGDYEGTVESIETRATMLKTYDGRRVVIPNGEIYTNSVMVNTAHEARRSQYDVGIGYGDDVRAAARVMLEAMQGVEGVLKDPSPDVLTVELAGSSVNLRARWWTAPERADVVHIAHEVITTIKEKLDEAAVDMPYPTQVLLFHDQTEATDGDRTQQREGWPAGDAPPKPRTIAYTLHQLAEKTGDGHTQDGSAQAGRPRDEAQAP